MVIIKANTSIQIKLNLLSWLAIMPKNTHAYLVVSRTFENITYLLFQESF